MRYARKDKWRIVWNVDIKHGDERRAVQRASKGHKRPRAHSTFTAGMCRMIMILTVSFIRQHVDMYVQARLTDRTFFVPERVIESVVRLWKIQQCISAQCVPVSVCVSIEH